MKKLLCVLAILLALVCVFAACDSTETPNTDNGNENTEQNGGGDTNQGGGNQNGGENNQTSHTHTYGAWSVKETATCTAKGEEKRTCACGESETREIAILAHTYGDWSVSKAATCTAKGEEKRTCACDESETREIAMLSHAYGEWSVSKAATCVAKGEEKRTCAGCPAFETKEIAATGEHTYGNWSVSKAVTCSTKGEKKRTCTGCTAFETQEIPAMSEHAYGTDNKCTVCKNPLVYTEGLEYILNDDEKSYTVQRGTATSVANIIIPPYYKSMPVTSVGNMAFAWCTSLTSIEIPASVTTIGMSAFTHCTSLMSVTFAENSRLTSIDAQAFSECVLLTLIEIPASVTSIGDWAFYKCTSLTSIEIPASVIAIGNHAFSGNYDAPMGLVSVIFSENSQLTSIGESAFDRCILLTSIKIPASVTSICDYAFYDCTSLMSIEIPASMNSIGSSAFSCCWKLIEVHNLSSLKITAGSSDYGYIGAYAKNIYTTTTQESKLFTDGNGYIFYDDGTDRYLMGYTGNNTTLTLPESCNGNNYTIYRSAFYQNSDELVSITIPSSVTAIDDYAFQYCASLTTVTLGKGSQLTSIGHYAFYGCTSLASIEISASVTFIGVSAFYNCTSLTSIEIPASVTFIATSAFQNCTSLVSVTFAQTNGWKASFTSISATDLYDPATAAKYLTDDYCSDDWNRTVE